MPEHTAKKIHMIPRGKASQRLLAVIAVLAATFLPVTDQSYAEDSLNTTVYSGGRSQGAEPGAQGTPIDCACAGDSWETGDRVVALVDHPANQSDVFAGDVGTVACGTTAGGGPGNLEILISWDGLSSGHGGNGYCECPVTSLPDRSGWYVRCNEIEADRSCFTIDAIDDQFSVINDGTTADFFVLANDECSGDTPISVVELPGDLLPDEGGSATTDGAKVSYTPAAGFVSPPFEAFTYTARDAGLQGDPPTVDQSTAWVEVTVDRDEFPDAVDDVVTAFENQAAIIDVLGNDEPGNAPAEVEIETEPANGSATPQTDDTIRYSPYPGFFGEDSFEYRLTDANGDSDVATVTVCVLFGGGQVPIDIMPSDPGNNLNLRAGQGASISVAVLSVGGFCGAPNLIDPLTLEFGPGQAGISGSPKFRDVDGDGYEDLIVKFLTHETGIPCGDTQASLFGRTFDSQPISGSDAINTFNCPRNRKRY
jgi:hypothetical protein